MNERSKVINGFARWAKRRKRREGEFDQEGGGWPKGEGGNLL